MKKNLLPIMIVAAGLMITACNNGPKNNENTVKDETETEQINNESDEEDVLDEDPTGIVSIRESWASQKINVNSGDQKPGIEQFALAFCKTYPQNDINHVLRDYLISPEDFGESDYSIEVLPSNGYIECMWLVQTAPLTDVCYWNRKNGHKLVAAYMEEDHESGVYSEHLAVFYDYDPETDIMTPEPSLTNMIEERVKEYDNFSVTLPSEGKDIQVFGFIDNLELDNCDVVEMELKWNGMTFDWAD